MKKACLIVILTVIYMLCGCSYSPMPIVTDLSAAEPKEQNILRQSNVSVYEVGSRSDSSINTSYSDYDYWRIENCSPQYRKDALKERTVIFEGKEYKGIYDYSCIDLYNNHYSDYYQFSDGVFSVNPLNDELELFAEFNENTGNVSSDTCLQKANQIASSYLDLSDFTITTRSDPFTHSILYQRYIDDIATCSKLSVGFNTQGDLVTFQRMMIDEMNSAIESYGEANLHELLALLTSETTMESLSQTFEENHNNYVTYNVQKPLLVILPNQSFGIVYIISYEKRLSNPDGTFDIWDDTAEYIITCNP